MEGRGRDRRGGEGRQERRIKGGEGTLDLAVCLLVLTILATGLGFHSTHI